MSDDGLARIPLPDLSDWEAVEDDGDLDVIGMGHLDAPEPDEATKRRMIEAICRYQPKDQP